MSYFDKHSFDKYCLLLISIGHFSKVRSAIFILLSLLLATPVNASSFSAWATQETQLYIEQYIERLTTEDDYRTNFKIGNIDPRLNLSICKSPLSFTFQGNPLERSKNTIKVTCTDQKRWSIFVGAKIDIFKDVWVASQTLPRGHRVRQSDLEHSEIQINKHRKGFFVNQQNIVGMLIRRSIQSGDVFYPGMLAPPKVIARGDTVIISALSDVISVQMMGTALSDGKLGQQISVRNKKSERVVRATVVSRGRVSVPM